MQRPGPRERLLYAADKLFAAHGYRATGVNQLLSEAKVAKASFYEHFPSKEALAVTHLERRHQEFFARLHERVKEHAHPTERIRALFRHAEADCAERGVGCVFMNYHAELAGENENLRSWVIRHHDALEAFCRDQVRALRAGDIADAEANEIAVSIVLLLSGAYARSRMKGTTEPFALAEKRASDLVANQVRAFAS